MFLLPIVALVLLWADRGSTSFVLPAIGLVIVFLGLIVVSTAVKPHEVMLAWEPEAMPPNWQAGPEKYFTNNWIQLVTTWSACALLLAH